MKKTIEFNRGAADLMAQKLVGAFYNAEHCFQQGDLARNIRNVCYWSELLRSLEVFGAEVEALGIYDDNGFDRIGYGEINGHEICKSGALKYDELKAALYEIADQE